MRTVNGRYAQVLGLLDEAGSAGRTWQEVAGLAGLSHGQASGALSNLANTGRLLKLPLRRNGCVVYLHPDHTEIVGRDFAGDAFDRGFALGMSEGYQDAVTTAHSEGYQQGWEEGVEALGRRMDQYLEEMVRAMQRRFGVHPAIQTDTSWMVQPSHTVQAVRRFLRRNVGPSQPDLPVPEGVVDLTMRRESR